MQNKIRFIVLRVDEDLFSKINRAVDMSPVNNRSAFLRDLIISPIVENPKGSGVVCLSADVESFHRDLSRAIGLFEQLILSGGLDVAANDNEVPVDSLKDDVLISLYTLQKQASTVIKELKRQKKKKAA